jgi:hypothetical protein
MTKQAVATQGNPAASDVPSVLFLCTHNAGRSQMALGFFRQLAGDRAIACPAALSPATRSTRRRGLRVSKGVNPNPHEAGCLGCRRHRA